MLNSKKMRKMEIGWQSNPGRSWWVYKIYKIQNSFEYKSSNSDAVSTRVDDSSKFLVYAYDEMFVCAL